MQQLAAADASVEDALRSDEEASPDKVIGLLSPVGKTAHFSNEFDTSDTDRAYSWFETSKLYHEHTESSEQLLASPGDRTPEDDHPGWSAVLQGAHIPDVDAFSAAVENFRAVVSAGGWERQGELAEQQQRANDWAEGPPQSAERKTVHAVISRSEAADAQRTASVELAGTFEAAIGACGPEKRAAEAGGFEGVDDAAEQHSIRLAGMLRRMIPNQWMVNIYPNLKGEKRERRLTEKLQQQSPDKLRAMIRTVEHVTAYCEDEEVSVYPLPEDTLMDILEEYKERAFERAAAAAARREASGKPPKANDRGGATAVKSIYLALETFRKVFGMSGLQSDTKMVREVAEVSDGMPKVQAMLRPDAVPALEAEMNDTSVKEFPRAYAAGLYLAISGSLRIKDCQRTAKVLVDECEVLGHPTLVANGIARKSKAVSVTKMKPLAWRAPLIPTWVGHEVDISCLLDSMADMPAGSGCMFRDFYVDEGMPHRIYNATAWADRAASHDTVVQAARDIIGSFACLGDEAEEFTGHKLRHVIPELGRALEFSIETREGLGYWAKSGAVGDANSARDQARAIELARARRSRAGNMANMAQRYGSVVAAPAEQDDARAACLLAIRAAVSSWTNGDETGYGASAPSTVAEQLRKIKSANAKKIVSPKKRKIPDATAPGNETSEPLAKAEIGLVTPKKPKGE